MTGPDGLQKVSCGSEKDADAALVPIQYQILFVRLRYDSCCRARMITGAEPVFLNLLPSGSGQDSAAQHPGLRSVWDIFLVVSRRGLVQ